MRPFSALYERVMCWARHRHAPCYLAVLSFTESSFFPIPPDVMLAPMALARPSSAWRYALLTTVASVLGALFGYLLGMFFFALLKPWIQHLGYMPVYLQAQLWFAKWGAVALLVAAFSPIPFKAFTVAAGAVHMAVLPFVIASFIGRGARFFLVAGLIKYGGVRMEQALRRWVEWIGWGMVGLLIGGYFLLKLI